MTDQTQLRDAIEPEDVMCLIVGDPVFGAAIGRQLAEAKFSCSCEVNGLDALSAIASVVPDVIVSQPEIELMGGLELCEYLQKTPEFDRVAVILAAEAWTPELVFSAVEQRVDSLIALPCDAASLAGHLMRSVRERRRSEHPAAHPHAVSPGRMLGTFCCELLNEMREARADNVQLDGRVHHLETLVDERTRELAYSEQTYRSLVQSNPDATLVVDGAGRIRYANPAADLMLDALDEDSIDQLFASIAAGKDVGTSQRDLSLLSRHGTRFVLELRTLPTRWQCEDSTVLTLRDITDRHEAEKQLKYLALHDPLTGLPNRIRFRERLDVLFATARVAESAQFSVLFIDLDRFKVVNDSLGHQAGDALLRHVAEVLQSSCRPNDLVARLGGDEFAILLESAGHPEDATTVVERIRDELARPLVIEGVEVSTTASIGIAMGPGDYTCADDIVKESDQAMYRAKGKRRGGHEFASPSSRAAGSTKLKLESELRRGISRGELVPYYQPITCLQSGFLRGFETLARWQRADGEIIGPDVFIPVALENGLIDKIEESLVKKACEQAADWHQRFPHKQPIFISFNVCGDRITSPGLAKRIAHAVRESGVKPDLMTMEITENSVMHGEASAENVLLMINELGLKIAIDDFGTGYSSLARLQTLPVQKLKVDRAFVDGIEHDPEKLAICEAIVALAKTLRKDVIAEGIENRAQEQILRDLGCQFGQGYYYARPLPLADAEAYIRSSKSIQLIDHEQWNDLGIEAMPATEVA